MTLMTLSLNFQRTTAPLSLYKPSELHEFLNSLGIEPKKGLSQNFLIDGNILRKLVSAANLNASDTVLEIGPGPGVLTEALLDSGASVIAIEKDEKLAQHLERLQNGKLKVLIDDFKNIRIKRLLNDLNQVKVIANIPYSITGLIIQTLLPMYPLISSIHLMVQKEVAQRCVALKKTKDYSSFTLFTKYHSDPKLVCTVSKPCFYPPPKVDSAILELKLKAPPVSAPYEKLFELIQLSFQQRRKMLRASLKGLHTPEVIEGALESIGLSKTSRPQELDLEDFSSLVFALESRNTH